MQTNQTPGLPNAVLLLLGAIAMASSSCASRESFVFDRERIETAVKARLLEFAAAERSLEPDRLLEFLADDFSMLQDGVRVDREATALQMRTSLPKLRSFEPLFEDVRIIPLAPGVAVTSMTFRDAMTGTSGKVTRMHGPSTLVWQRRGDTWVIVFADSDHYPDEDGSQLDSPNSVSQ